MSLSRKASQASRVRRTSRSCVSSRRIAASPSNSSFSAPFTLAGCHARLPSTSMSPRRTFSRTRSGKYGSKSVMSRLPSARCACVSKLPQRVSPLKSMRPALLIVAVVLNRTSASGELDHPRSVASMPEIVNFAALGSVRSSRSARALRSRSSGKRSCHGAESSAVVVVGAAGVALGNAVAAPAAGSSLSPARAASDTPRVSSQVRMRASSMPIRPRSTWRAARSTEALLTVSRPISISGVLRPRTCNARSATTNVSSVSLPDNGVVAAENW